MDDFLRLSDEEKDQNQKPNLAAAHVDRERIERLKRSFLPSWMRWIREQKADSDQTPSKSRSSNASVDTN